MRGAIERKHRCTELFAADSTIKEVYAPLDFDFLNDSATLIFYTTKFFDSSKMLFELAPMWDNKLTIRVVDNPYDGLLQGKRIIWRKGEWYA